MSVEAPPAPAAAPAPLSPPVTGTGAPNVVVAADRARHVLVLVARSRRDVGVRVVRWSLLDLRRRRGTAASVVDGGRARRSRRVPERDGRYRRERRPLGPRRARARHSPHRDLQAAPDPRGSASHRDARFVLRGRLHRPRAPGTTSATRPSGPGQPSRRSTVGQTASLQTTLGDLDNLLIELHPGRARRRPDRSGRGAPGPGNLARQELRQGEQLLPTDAAALAHCRCRT